MTETLMAICPECGPSSGEVDEHWGFWTCEGCERSWLMSDVHGAFGRTR